MKQLLKRGLIYPLQAVAIYAAYYICRLMPIEWASAFGAFLFRTIGSRMRVDLVARRNLQRAFPDKSETGIDIIVRGMWDNLGRGAGEYAHLDRIDVTKPDSRIEVVGGEVLEMLRDDGQPGILVGGHLGNWECSTLIAAQFGIPLASIYRSAANPWLDRLFQNVRGGPVNEVLFKGRKGAHRALAILREGGHIGVMVDQKLNAGIAVPFFGRPAMTTPMPAQLALRLQCPLVPVRFERLPGVRYRVTLYQPLALPDSGDKAADTLALMTEINLLLESWILERPEQWFWVHRRWPD
jgi:KDO2-lipid IV(A) lauroyltransferase